MFFLWQTKLQEECWLIHELRSSFSAKRTDLTVSGIMEMLCSIPSVSWAQVSFVMVTRQSHLIIMAVTLSCTWCKRRSKLQPFFNLLVAVSLEDYKALGFSCPSRTRVAYLPNEVGNPFIECIYPKCQSHQIIPGVAFSHNGRQL